jgi:hypothetical protein
MSVRGDNYFKKEIDIMKSLVITLLVLILLPSIARAVPSLYNPLPLNNSIFSGGEIEFSINITEPDLNVSSVILHIISEDAYLQNESWENYTMSCTNYEAANWNCSIKKSFPTVGSDTVELFYFEAMDNSGNTGLNGTSNISDSLRFSLDRKAPLIEFINPKNSTWVSGIEDIELNIYDALSGVNYSTVNYSFDDVHWFNTTPSTYFSATWNTTGLANNQTVTIYAKASDNVNNMNETSINVTVDNELPVITILNPAQNQILKLAVTFAINASDSYSGISSATFSIGGITEKMDCIGSNNSTCTKLFDTFTIPDGIYTMNFSVTDNAGNTNTSSVQVEVANIISSITIVYPYNNSIVRNVITLRASLSDPTDVNEVKYLLSQSGNILENNTMSCTWDYSSCIASLNTTQYQDGQYFVMVRSISSQKGILSNSSIVLIFNNTVPASPATNQINNTSTNQTTENKTENNNKTGQTPSNTPQNTTNIFTNPKVIIPSSLAVIALIAISIILLRKKPEKKPWYDTIGKEPAGDD